jgi:hypothetical protein
MLQTSELAQAFPISEDTRKALAGVSHYVMLKLVACFDLAEPIRQQVAEGKAQIDSGDMPISTGSAALQLPAVVDLRAKAEGFLYNCKLALRDIAGLFEPFYCQRFDHRYQRITAWAAETFGANDRLVRLLAENASSIKRVIDMRNAVDHPGSGDGTLFVENFRVIASAPRLVIAEPSWYRDAEAPVPIADDMKVIQHNLLTLYEDILVDLLLRTAPNGPLVIYEIPEADRDPSRPVRLRVGLSSALPST